MLQSDTNTIKESDIANYVAKQAEENIFNRQNG